MRNKHSRTCWKNKISQAMEYKNNDISNLIPDYCNNRLDANEKAEFESLLQQDRDLLEECNDFQEFQQMYRRIDPVEPSPSDAIFNQISSKVSVHQKAERKATVQFGSQVESILESIRDIWQQTREFVTVPWMLAAAQTVVIVLLLMPAAQQNTYSTLSETKVAVTAEKTSINVVFRPNAVESDIRSLLHTIQGSVSSGPSKEGRYVVSISSQSELEKAMLTLKQSQIVLFAEPAR